MLILRLWLSLVLVASALFFGLIIAEMAKAEDTLQATITWKNTDLARKIQIEKSATATGNFSLLARLDAGSTSYVDATVKPGERWCYRLAYFDTVNVHSRSAARCKTYSLTASPPSSVTVR